MLLAGALVKLNEHVSLSRETVRRRPKENELKPWRKDMWCIPRVDGEFVARMEDVLRADPVDVYRRQGAREDEPRLRGTATSAGCRP